MTTLRPEYTLHSCDVRLRKDIMAEQIANQPLFGHRTVTPDSVARFGILTGDYAQLHFDHHFGETTPYGIGIAHGLLSASLALGALTQYRPGRVGHGAPNAFVSEYAVRFGDVVRFGDTLALRCAERDTSGEASRWPASNAGKDWNRASIDFEFQNQDERIPTRGELTLVSAEPTPNGDPRLDWPGSDATPWPSTPLEIPQAEGGLAAQDLMERGPRGESLVATVTETDVVSFARFTGDVNPLYLDEEFAKGSLFGSRIAPPMLCFCLGFSAWLRVLLSIELAGSRGTFAGHLGDRWRFVAPVRIGDTLVVRHRPTDLRRSRSQPERGVMTFGLQLVNQREEVVLDGAVDMMLPMREGD